MVNESKRSLREPYPNHIESKRSLREPCPNHEWSMSQNVRYVNMMWDGERVMSGATSRSIGASVAAPRRFGVEVGGEGGSFLFV